MVFRHVEPTDLPGVLDGDPVDAYHRALLVDPAHTVEQVVTLFNVCLDILILWRGKVGEIAPRRIAVEPVLDDPAHDDHPGRPSWVMQYGAMVREESVALEHVVVETWALNRFWWHLKPRDRKTHGLDVLVGLHYARQDIGRDLPFLTTGPLQDQAPLPIPYEPPEGFYDGVVPNFQTMLNHCPF